jgi:hypothetical protein
MNRRQALSMLAILAGSALPLEQLEAALEVKETYTMDDIEIVWKELSRSADGKVIRGEMTVTIPWSPEVENLKFELEDIQREHLK